MGIYKLFKNLSMSETKNLIKVGNVVLTPEALNFIESLQYERNEIVHSYSKKLSEMISGMLILINHGSVSEEVEQRLISNAADLASLAFEIEQLAKP